MWEILVSFILVVLEIVIGHVLFAAFLPKRFKKKWQYTLIILLQIFLAYLMAQFFASHVETAIYPFKLIIMLSMLFIFMEIVYCGSLWRILFYLVCHQCILALIDSIGMFLIVQAEGGTIEDFWEYAVVSLLCKMLELIVVILIGRKFGYKKEYAMLERKIWIRFLFFPIFTIVTASVFLAEDNWGRTSVVIITIGLILSNLLLYYLLQDYAKSEYEKWEFMRQQERVKGQKGVYESIRNSYFAQRARAHEFQLSLEKIQVMLEESRIREAKQYIEETNRQIGEQRKYYSTSNAVVDAIVNEKYRQAEKEGIVIILKLADMSQFPVQETTAGIMLGTIMDGAYNACRRLEKSLFKVYIEHEESQWRISVNLPLEETARNAVSEHIWHEEMPIRQIQNMLDEKKVEILCSSGIRGLNYHLIIEE